MVQLAFVGNTLRRLYNSVETRFDRRVLNQETRIVRQSDSSRNPLTVREALTKIWPVIQELDEEAYLKAISAPAGVDAFGRSSRWNFMFELHNRRARLYCCWILPPIADGEAVAEKHNPIIDAKVKPFPPEDSVYRQMVAQGKMLCHELTELWHQERKRRPDLPTQFRDSDVVIRELTQKGLDITTHRFTLSTSKATTGRLSWMARVDDYAFYVNFRG